MLCVSTSTKLEQTTKVFLDNKKTLITDLLFYYVQTETQVAVFSTYLFTREYQTIT